MNTAPSTTEYERCKYFLILIICLEPLSFHIEYKSIELNKICRDSGQRQQPIGERKKTPMSNPNCSEKDRTLFTEQWSSIFQANANLFEPCPNHQHGIKDSNIVKGPERHLFG